MVWNNNQTRFDRNLAIVIGIDRYKNHPSIRNLSTAVSDATAIADLLEQVYDYKQSSHNPTVIRLLNEEATLAGLQHVFSQTLIEHKLTERDRLIVYFAGHGLPRSNKNGPEGYLVPHDADPDNPDSFLAMRYVSDALSKLACHHLLIILDCCFAGTFQWAGSRKAIPILETISREHYYHFIRYPAWQVITSSAHDQEALDTARLQEDNRQTVTGEVETPFAHERHSPFALALLEGLHPGDGLQRVKADLSPDGVVTAHELFVYLQKRVKELSDEQQAPGLYPLRRDYDKGEFIFTPPEFDPEKALAAALPLNEDNNPYRGLNSFDEKHAKFFFGRQALVDELAERLSQSDRALTVVLGISGSGKSSLVKAGLLPRLRNPKTERQTEQQAQQWYILDPMRPGELPFVSLGRVLLPVVNPELLEQVAQDSFLDKLLKKEQTQTKQDSLSVIQNRQDQVDETLVKVADLWNQATPEARLLLIEDYFEQLKTLVKPQQQEHIKQLYDQILETLNSVSKKLQNDPQYFSHTISTWSQQHPNVKLLLVIDQFEELLTTSQAKSEQVQSVEPESAQVVPQNKNQPEQQSQKRKEWQTFLDVLRVAIAEQPQTLRLVLTLRSDFEPRFLNSPLEPYWKEARFTVQAMNQNELRQAIENPALKQALYFEELTDDSGNPTGNLVNKLIDEVGQMPGALPLLSFTLSELYVSLYERWKNNPNYTDRTLRFQDYEDLGGVAGALSRRANQEYEALDENHRATLRRVMLRMVALDGAEVARRRVSTDELNYPSLEENQRVALVIDRLVKARLLVKGQEKETTYIEPAHDYLISGWARLTIWIQDEKANLALQRQLTQAAVKWASLRNNYQPPQGLGRADTVVSWLDRRLSTIEDSVNKILDQVVQRWRQAPNQQERANEKPAQFLWNANPYLDVLNNTLTSKHYWFNQIESEFVQQSVQQKRRNVSWRWRIAISVILVLSGLTIATLIGQRSSQIKQISASQQAAEANLLSNQELDALVNSLQAAKTLQKSILLQLFKPGIQLQNEIRLTLQKAVNQINERNRIVLYNGGNKIAFSPDELLLAIAHNDHSIGLWDRSGKLINNLQIDNNSEIQSIGFTSNSQQIITISTENVLQFWDLNGQKIGEDQTLPGRFNRLITDSPGKPLLVNESENNFSLWNIENGTRIAELYIEDESGYGTYSPNGQFIAGSTRAGDTISLQNITTNQVIELKGSSFDSNIPISVHFSPDSRLIATGGYLDDTIHIWDINGNPIAKLLANQGGINYIKFSPDGSQLASLGVDGTLRIWQNLEGKQSKGIRLPPDTNEVDISSDGQLLAVSDQRERVQIINLSTEQQFEIPQQFEAVAEFLFSPIKNSFIVSERNGTVYWFDLDNQQELASFVVQTANIDQYGSFVSAQGYRLSQGLSLGQGGSPLAIGGNNDLTVINSSGQELAKISEVTSSLDSNYFAENWIQATAFSPNGDLLATAGVGGDIRIWRWQEGKQVLVEPFQTTATQISSIAFNPTGNLIATAEIDGSVSRVILRKLSGSQLTQITEFEGHQGFVNQVIFSPDGDLVATAGADGTARVWNLSGQQIAQFTGATQLEVAQQVESIAFSPDGQQLTFVYAIYGNSYAKGATTWSIQNTDQLLIQGCDWARDYLKNNPNVNESDRKLCDGIRSLNLDGSF